jgi:hypothetical protein
MEVSWTDEHNNLFRAIVSSNELDLIQVECPIPFSTQQHFTIFWRGRASLDDLHGFVSGSFRPHEDALSALFFFPHLKLRLPPYTATKFPSLLEEAVTHTYGSPTFARYEVYPKDIVTEDLQSTLYSLWGSVSSPADSFIRRPDHEIGLFTLLGVLEDKMISSELHRLIKNTIHKDLNDESVLNLLEISHEILRERLRK